jgi:4-hydroxy-2-oxoheptanedioate aldolase
MTTEFQRNAFKHAIAAGKLQIGLWSSLCSNIAAEIISDSGFDWILLDSEHSPNEIPDLFGQLQAVARGTATPIIRPAWNDAVLAKRALDIGAQTLLFPYVQNAEEARRAVASMRYPPEGIRGVAVASRASRFGRTPGYLTRANSEMCTLVQVETRSALDQLESIASVEGVDGVFIGPSDLAASLGHLGNPQAPEAQKAIQDAGKRLKAIGKPAGILTGNEEEARRYMDWGYLFVAVGADVGLLAKNADALAKKALCVRSKIASRPGAIVAWGTRRRPCRANPFTTSRIWAAWNCSRPSPTRACGISATCSAWSRCTKPGTRSICAATVTTPPRR